MMGSTKLSTIRADLRAAFSKAKMDVQWFDREIKKLEQERPTMAELHSAEFSELTLARWMAASAAAELVAAVAAERPRVRPGSGLSDHFAPGPILILNPDKPATSPESASHAAYPSLESQPYPPPRP